MDAISNPSFYVKDCALASIATGLKARSLIEFRDILSSIPASSIYYHFWGGRLRTSFEHREYHNDFSSWVHSQLHDEVLAERLEILNPHEYEMMEDLQTEIVEIIDTRLDETEFIPWAKSEGQFHFLESKIIIFQTRHQIDEPKQLVQMIPLLTKSSLFYHFIDAYRRTPMHKDDFSIWLENFDGKYASLIEAIESIDPFFISLADLQNKLIQLTTQHFLEGT